MRGRRLDIDRLRKSYGDRRVLDDVSCSVEPGEICGLLGPNGAGKTTLVSIISGLRDADGGSVSIGGLDVAGGGSEVRGLVGLAGQETGVYPTVTVSENLLLFAGLAGLGGRGRANRERRKERIDEVAEIFDLTDLMGRLARDLSGGERRRLHTAMALVHRPAVLLLDEPTTGVDVGSRSRLLAAVRRLAADDGCTVLYSTHYLPEIEELGATVAILDHGALVTRGPLDQLISRYGTGSVSITFDGPAPAIARTLPDEAVIEATDDGGCVLTLVTDRGGAALAELIVAIGTASERVRSVDINRPDLESVFRTLTGRTYDAGEPAAPAGAR